MLGVTVPQSLCAFAVERPTLHTPNDGRLADLVVAEHGGAIRSSAALSRSRSYMQIRTGPTGPVLPG